MSGEDVSQPMKPQEQIIYLLGELTGKMTALQASVDTAQTSQAATNSAHASQLASLRSDVDVIQAVMPNVATRAEVQAVRQSIPTRTPWFSIVGGVAGVGAIVLSLITLLNMVVVR